LSSIAGMEFSQVLTFAPLTPFVFALALRYPLQRGNWVNRSLLHLAAGIVFTLAHISLRAMTPYGYWDQAHRQWTSAIWDSHAHAFRMAPWAVLRSMFLGSVVDDITSVYIPIVLIAHAVSYYHRFRERELRATQLEGQLAKAHLQTLKSQLQPHFLFNTMHSISALMLTDVNAADRMMSRLSDLLRISLEAAGTQITTLNRELEFVNCYLDIEKVRFEERMNVIFDIAPETLDAQVPHLLLQPLVDNAVKHGISKLQGGGEIRITVNRQNGDLQLKITDNGPGLRGLSTLPANGLGLRITRERLESLYGQNQSLEVVSPPHGGLTICVSISIENPAGDDGRREFCKERVVSSPAGTPVSFFHRTPIALRLAAAARQTGDSNSDSHAGASKDSITWVSCNSNPTSRRLKSKPMRLNFPADIPRIPWKLQHTGVFPTSAMLSLRSVSPIRSSFN